MGFINQQTTGEAPPNAMENYQQFPELGFPELVAACGEPNTHAVHKSGVLKYPSVIKRGKLGNMKYPVN